MSSINHMKKVLLIIPYYGKFPNYFQLWLDSATNNSDFDFLIFTDLKHDCYQYGKNIKFVYLTFSELREQIKKKIDNNICLNTYYKLCDYKPAYGLIFSDHLNEYDYWGYCDCDLIFGDLSKYLLEPLNDDYEKLGKLGHLTLYKNSEKMKKWFLNINKKIKLDYSYAFFTNYPCHFDESEHWNEFNNELKQYTIDTFADIYIDSYAFNCIYDSKIDQKKQIFYWDNGKLLCYFLNEENRIQVKEYLYIHLQKRKMDMKYEINNKKYLIVPNKFLPVSKIDVDIINEFSKNKFLYLERKKKRIREIFKNIKDGAFQFRLHILKKGKE